MDHKFSFSLAIISESILILPKSCTTDIICFWEDDVSEIYDLTIFDKYGMFTPIFEIVERVTDEFWFTSHIAYVLFCRIVRSVGGEDFSIFDEGFLTIISTRIGKVIPIF